MSDKIQELWILQVDFLFLFQNQNNGCRIQPAATLGETGPWIASGWCGIWEYAVCARATDVVVRDIGKARSLHSASLRSRDRLVIRLIVG